MLKFVIGMIFGLLLGVVMSYTPNTNQYIQPYSNYLDVSELVG